MLVRFWGTRGSIAAPGPDTIHFGGNTSCVELTTDDDRRFVVDCGTGARPLGVHWMANVPRPIRANILIGHTHWDHIQGFPFFAPLFISGNEFSVYAPNGEGNSLHQVLAGQMEFTYFPVELGQLPAALTYFDLAEGLHEIGGAQVEARYLNHPVAALGYRIQADGVSVVYLSDHEPFSDTLWRHDKPPGRIESILHEGDLRHARFMAGADLVIHDAQYTPEEYPAKKNWGHSTYEYVVGLASAAGVRKLALTHHDPTHSDVFLAELEGRAQEAARGWGASTEVFCAYEGLELRVECPTGNQRAAPILSVEPVSTANQNCILVVDDTESHRNLAKLTLERWNFNVHLAEGGAEALRILEILHPDLVLLDMMMPKPDGLDVLKTLRAMPQNANLPVILLTSRNDEATTHACFEAGATDYITKPYTLPQLIARVRACLARVED
jgi:CheY-like chemotaxis protein/phosphoribosyl 1,2-cyclic phosphodiesterase